MSNQRAVKQASLSQSSNNMLDSSFLQNFKVVKMLLLLNSKRHSPNNVMLLTREALLFRPVSLRIPSFSVPNKYQETINIEKGILTRINRNLRKKKRSASPFSPSPSDICEQVEVFFIRVFHIHWEFTKLLGKGGYHPLFLSTTSTSSRTFIHLFATLHAR